MTAICVVSRNDTHSEGAPTTRSAERQYDNLCGICFTEVHPTENPRGRLNSCDHLFCSYCIKQWAANTNVCPACKARFTRIYTKLADADSEQETRVRRRNFVDWLDHTDDAADGNVPRSETLAERRNRRFRSEHQDPRTDAEGGSNSDRRQGRGEAADSVTVRCNVCQEDTNASRMIFCDRRECTFVAHLDCLCLGERPLTFLCSSCALSRARLSDGATDPAAALSDEQRMSSSSISSSSSNSFSELMTPQVSASNSHRTSCSGGSESGDCSNNDNNRSNNVVTSSLPGARITATNRDGNDGVVDVVVSPPRARVGRRLSTGETPAHPSIPAPAPTPYRKVAVTGSVHNWRARVGASPPPTLATQRLSSSALRARRDTSPASHAARTTATASATAGALTAQSHERAADDERVDLSRCNLTFDTPILTPLSSSTPAVSDEFYFLHPNPHASAAMIDLQRQREARQHEADTRALRNASKARRMQRVYGGLLQHQSSVSPRAADTSDGLPYGSRHSHQEADLYDYGSPHRRGASPAAVTESTTPAPVDRTRPWPTSSRPGARRRRSTAARDAETVAEMQQRQLALEESEYTDPHRRQALEDRLTRQWAEDFIPSLRRNRDIAENRLRLHDRLQIVYDAPLSQAEQEQRERVLWEQAMKQAREVVRHKMQYAAVQIRQRREHMVKLNAAREAMALAKLARIIAAHRVSPSQDTHHPVDDSDVESIMSSVSQSRYRGGAGREGTR